MTAMTLAEWEAEGVRRFGEDRMQWRWICPACEHEQSMQDYADAGAPAAAVGFSCVGRWLPAFRQAFVEGSNEDNPGPCNYAGGGLIGLNPVEVADGDGPPYRVFAFAEPKAVPKRSEGAPNSPVVESVE